MMTDGSTGSTNSSGSSVFSYTRAWGSATSVPAQLVAFVDPGDYRGLEAMVVEERREREKQRKGAKQIWNAKLENWCIVCHRSRVRG
jgi:mono/diheme cytochrome c family protein